MPSPITHTMNTTVWIMLVLLSVLWGGSFFFVGIAVEELTPLTIVALRVGIAAIALWSFAFAIGLRPPKQVKVWGLFLAMGLLNNVIPFLLIVWGQTQIASGLASILNAATPIFAVVVAGLFLPDEKPTPLKLFGVAIGFIGVVVMIGVPALSGNSHLLAQLAIIAATICYAFAGVFGRRFKALEIPPVIIASGQVTASAFILLPITFIVDGKAALSAASNQTWLAILGLAIISTAIAYVLYFKILEIAGATNVLLVTLLVPVSAVLLGSVFLDESLELIHLLGMLMIALGLSAIDGRIWYRLKAMFY
ncbi:DMT family transporter [Vibrio methylphosphonaticus]|uniref:DMT family transporter n=1 Tax=Vibrio methylphosphonaticus TaxID=2946866 RepID=UPI00202A3425|nr:DMT family transporter [Vibrio methylphosphonaticus]MCL9776209.1 DMT family transporter [Vibrio methylphosphonaticus]